MVLSAGAQLIRLENILEADQRINQLYDACFMPRTQNVTGQLDAHDVGVDADGRILFVNTRYNCLATVSERHSFEEVWRPSFITELVDEDRCHLNGLAMRDGKPAFVTAVSKSNTIDGWRDRRADGGVVIDVESGAIVCEGLSMPHSPRWHDGKLWVLNSGTGDLGYVEFPDATKSKRRKPGSKAGAKSASKSPAKSPSKTSSKAADKSAEPSNTTVAGHGQIQAGGLLSRLPARADLQERLCIRRPLAAPLQAFRRTGARPAVAQCGQRTLVRRAGD